MWCYEGVFHTIIVISCKPSCPVIGLYVISILIQSAVTKLFWYRSGIYYITKGLRSHYWASFSVSPQTGIYHVFRQEQAYLKKVWQQGRMPRCNLLQDWQLADCSFKKFFRKSPWFSCLGVAGSKRAGGVVGGV